MKVADFKNFIKIAALARLDISPQNVSFSPNPLCAGYEGLHMMALRKGTSELQIDNLTEPIAMNAVSLLNGLNLLGDEAELKAKVTGSSLVLTTGGKRLTLRYIPGYIPEVRRPAAEAATVLIEREALLNAVTFLTDVTTRKVTSPILTGINCQGQDGEVTLSATDMYRAGTVVLAGETKHGMLDVVFPAIDLREALRACVGSRVVLQADEKSFFVKDEYTFIRSSLLMGAFPDFSALVTVAKYAAELLIGHKVIEVVDRAASLLDSHRAVILRIEQKKVFFSIMGQELGSFDIAVGREEIPDLTLSVDSAYLALAAHLGDKLTIKIVSPHHPVLLESSRGWKYWISPLISQ